MNLAASLASLGVRDEDHVGVAVSGGADSIALMHMAADLRPVHVLHVDHGLRTGSRGDGAFVEHEAGRLGLACCVLPVEVEVHRAASVEAAARAARYTALEAAARRLRLDWVATAHTLDDQAETVLMRALRGSGTGGLGGIHPVRGKFVRPLLDARRSDLRAWLTGHGHTWREDETNLDTRFERNWVRNDLMPLIEARRAGAASALARSAEFARRDDDTLETLAAGVVERAESDDAGVLLEDLRLLPRSVAGRAVRQVCWRLGVEPSAGDVALMLSTDGARCGGVVARRIGGRLALMRDPAPVPPEVQVTAAVESRAWGVRARIGATLRWSSPVPSGRRLVLRSRRPGDRVRTRAGSRKVSDVLIDAKIPRALRDFVPILATEDSALAVVGLTTYDASSDTLLGVEPHDPTWTRAAVWMERWT